MNSILEIRAGSSALLRIRDEGVAQENIEVVVGASGGPKWFVVSGLDRALLKDFFRDRQSPLHLLGTSSGCWRFSCYGQADPLAAHNRFEQGYLHQNYSEKADAREISTKAWQLLNEVIPEGAEEEILNHPYMRFNLITVRSRGLCGSNKKGILGAGLGIAAFSNLLNRKLLGCSFTRTLFHHPATLPPFYNINDLPTERVMLRADNLKTAIMASGSVPLVMEGISRIAGAPEGVYRDGGITDYHFDMPFNNSDGLVLYPHFYNRMIPGWFDKRLSWRQPQPFNCKNVVLVSPSADFVSKLPFGKIPDRKDFDTLDFKERLAYWKKVINASDRLGEAFLELAHSNKIKRVVEPLL